MAAAPLLVPPPADGDWLPSGKKAAICFSIDDVHPASSRDAYDAGGDLGTGALGHVEWLLRRHPQLRVTLFTTPAWRLRSPLPTRHLLSRLPVARQALFLAPVYSARRMRVDRHPAFVEYLNSLPRAEIALHGLHHARRGPAFHVEFRGRSRRACRAMLERALRITAQAGLRTVPGFQAPGWEVHDDLAEALADTGFRFVAGARDVRTPIAADAVCDMSGPRGVSLLHPQSIAGGRLTHVATNFQATSSIDRAVETAEHGGLISIKAHIYKRAYSYVALDGLDLSYRSYLDRVFSLLADRYGDGLWWTSMNEIAQRMHNSPSPS
jgi:predicted deacetylase